MMAEINGHLVRVKVMQIEEKIRNYIAQNILFSKNSYPYEDHVSFLEEGIVDSTSVLELVMFVEDQFNISVEDHEITPDNFDSVASLGDYIRRKQG
jgi:acyl carrier protein